MLRVGLLSALMLVTRTRSRGTRRAVFPYVFRFMSMLRRGVVVPRTPTRISSVLPQRSVNSFDATWFPHLFRFEKTDFPVLLEALQIPAVVNTGVTRVYRALAQDGMLLAMTRHHTSASCIPVQVSFSFGLRSFRTYFCV